jgi:hypothetical protein
VKTYEYAGDPFREPRSHPWRDAVGSAAHRYYDFSVSPAHIRSSLEDFLPWNRFAGVEAFYALLERLNHPKSALESNDCAFSGPHPNEDTSVAKALQCSGRVMILFRALQRNTEDGRIDWLKNELHGALIALDPDFRWGVVGTTSIPVRYLALPENDEQQLGTQLMISFWAWGDREADTMQNFGRLINNLARALRQVSAAAARAD